MTFDANRDHRRSVRFSGYDYRAAGTCFVTVCAARRGNVFGKIENGAVTLNAYGRIVAEEWQRSAELRAEIELDVFIVMPDHFHAIVFLRDDRRGMACHAQNAAPNQNLAAPPEGMARHAPTFGKPQSHSLARVIGSFKSAVTRGINTHRGAQNRSPVQVWQRNYHERIIRTEKELNETRRYILDNPARRALSK